MQILRGALFCECLSWIGENLPNSFSSTDKCAMKLLCCIVDLCKANAKKTGNYNNNSREMKCECPDNVDQDYKKSSKTCLHVGLLLCVISDRHIWNKEHPN